MKLIKTEDAVGHVLCHDLTQIIKDQYKDARFRKGHVVTQEDIPVLLSMGKEHLYVWEMTPGMLHENDGAERLCALCANEHMDRSGDFRGPNTCRPPPLKKAKLSCAPTAMACFSSAPSACSPSTRRTRS